MSIKYIRNNLTLYNTIQRQLSISYESINSVTNKLVQ